jgi:hypothetical protein
LWRDLLAMRQQMDAQFRSAGFDNTLGGLPPNGPVAG